MMKLIAIAFILLAGPVANAFSCLDFSGTYQESTSEFEFSISQVACSHLTLTYAIDSNTEIQEFILDGKKYKMLETPEATWWAAAVFASNREDILIENETLFANGKKVKSTRRLRLDSIYKPGKTYLLDQSGSLSADGRFVARDSTVFLKK